LAESEGQPHLIKALDGVVRGPILVVIDADLRGRRLADQSVDRRVDGTDQHPLREYFARPPRRVQHRT
jgi:hypothetical protein